MPRRRNPYGYVKPSVSDEIVDLSRQGYRPSQIHRELLEEGFDAGDVPHVRTIRRYVKDSAAADAADAKSAWRLTDADAEQVPLVVPVLAYIAQATVGRISSVTVMEAQIIERIRRAAPDLPTTTCWLLTQRYIALPDEGEELERYYDLFLAVAPWRDEERRAQYESLVNRLDLPDRDKTLLLILSDSSRGGSRPQIKKEEGDGKGTRKTAGRKVVRGDEHRKGRKRTA